MLRAMSTAALVLLPALAGLLLPACSDRGGDSGAVGEGAPKPELLPFPSAHLVGSDGRLAIPAGLLAMPEGGTPFPVERLAWRDGFSVVQTTVIDPEVALDGASLPGVEQLGQPGSVQLWDLTAGRALPVFAEVDAWCDPQWNAAAAADPACGQEVPLLLVRPLQPMTVGHRVAVAVTSQVQTADGASWTGPAWYRDLRAGRPGPGLAEWAEHYAGLEAELQALGVQDLVFAVDFPVGEGTTPTRSMLSELSTPTAWEWTSTRDADLGDAVPPRTWKRLEGRYTTDSWLAEDLAFELDEQGRPARAGTAQAALYVHLPDSVRDAAPGTAPVWIFGHGIFSQPSDYLGDDDDPNGLVELADRAGAIVVATTWRGLTYTDLPTAIGVGNDFGTLPRLTDKLSQGVANNAALVRLVQEGGLLDDPLLEGKADPATVRYLGISLGGIEGAVLMAVEPRLPHAVLHVGGSAWSTMLERSSNWPTFETLVAYGIGSPADRQVLYAASQLYWDAADPAGYAVDLQGRSVLWQQSMGDEQVPNLTTESLARGAAAVLVEPAVEPVPLLEAAQGPLQGPALMQLDPLLGRPPPVNRPAPVTGAHASPRLWDTTMEQTMRFLDPDDPGVVEHPCAGTPCTADNADLPGEG